MTFDLFTIALFSGAALIYAALLPVQWRGWALMIGSVIAVYWLQPRLPIRFSDYIFPTLTILLAVMGWFVTRKPGEENPNQRESWITLAVVALLVMGMSLFRYIDADYRLTPSRPPNPLWVVYGLAVIGVIFCIVLRFSSPTRLYVGFFALTFTLFIGLKAEPLAKGISWYGRTLSGQDTSLASAIDLNWLGFSYVAFRLLHTLRDRQSGLLPSLSLREYLTYIVFFPSFTAGPIDRAERFQEDYRALTEMQGLDGARFTDGLTRITVGIFKKFVIADSLAVGLSLNVVNAGQAESTLWLWVLLYGYALRLFFDFSGYSDIAIGIGVLFGIKLPENFNAPYLKTDITKFWQSWHMTLSNWARFYVFSPLSRHLLRRKPRPSPTLIVLMTQLATMVTIGLWHGITWNFFIWGMWHGIGLFVHKQWSDRTRKWERSLKDKPLQRRTYIALAWLATFQFVVLGWVWFALPDVQDSLRVLSLLFGVQ